MRHAHRRSREHRQPPARHREQTGEEEKQAERERIQKDFGLHHDRAIEKHAECRRGQQRQRVNCREFAAENREEQGQQNDRQIDVEGLRTLEEFLFGQAGRVDEREEKRQGRHSSALPRRRVIRFIHSHRIGEISVLVALHRRRRLRMAAGVRLDGVDPEHDNGGEHPGMTPQERKRHGVCHPRRIRLTAIAARSNEISFDTPFIPCLPIHRVKWLA